MPPSFPSPALPRLAIPFIVSLFALCAVVALTAPRAEANGGADTRTIFEGPVEAYQVVVTSTPGRPTEGRVHLTFSISNAATGDIITDAVLMVSTTPPPESELTENSFPVDRSTVNPDLYDQDVELTSEGVWGIALSIDGPLGLAETSFPLEVRGPASKIFAILIVVLAFPLLLLLLEVWRRWDRRKKRAQQTCGSAVIDTDTSNKESVSSCDA